MIVKHTDGRGHPPFKTFNESVVSTDFPMPKAVMIQPQADSLTSEENVSSL